MLRQPSTRPTSKTWLRSRPGWTLLGKDTGKKSGSSLTAVAKTARDAKILAQSSTMTANVASEFCKTNKDDLDEHKNVIKELKRKLVEFEGMITHDVSVLWAYLKKVMDHADSGWRTKVGYKEPTGPAPLLRINVHPKWDWLVQMTPPALEAHHPPCFDRKAQEPTQQSHRQSAGEGATTTECPHQPGPFHATRAGPAVNGHIAHAAASTRRRSAS